jgi:hypothetical protein
MERGYADEDTPAVWRSRIAHNRYMDALAGVDEHTLVITESDRLPPLQPETD